MDFLTLDDETITQLKNLAAALCTSKQFPYAARAGEVLAAQLPRATPAPASNIDSLLTDLQHRYQTPVPEAYLSESIAKQQSQRRQHGVFYTPWPLAQFLTCSAVEIAEREFPGEAPTWLDPACGGGVFLHTLLSGSSVPRGAVHGWDRSPVAAAVCQSILQARGNSQVQVEWRDALQFDPAAERVCVGNEPLIVIGNPPYSNFGKRTISPWLAAALGDYKPARGEKKTNLRDAFLLFLRLAQSLIQAQGRGVVAMVLSTTFLDAITHAQVRDSLLSTFDELRVLRLESPEVVGDENLFAIRQPTAACLFIRRHAESTKEKGKRKGAMFQASLWGSRDQKLDWLSKHSVLATDWTVSTEDASSCAPAWYASSPPIPVYFSQYISGVQTKNDSLFLARSRTQLEAQIRARFHTFDPSLVQPILVAPFDPWWIYYDPALLGRARYSVMKHMMGDNLALVFMRQATGEGEYDHFLVTRSLVTDRVFHSRWGAPFLAPLYSWEYGERRANVRQTPPENWLGFAYALVHSHWYRQSAADALRSDFPRLPLLEQLDRAVVEQLTNLGMRLIELHAPQGGWSAFLTADDHPSMMKVGRGYPRIEVVGSIVPVLITSGECLAEVARDVWNYRIGGVEVLKRFLLRRRGTQLWEWEAAHFRHVCQSLAETIAIREQLNSLPLRIS